MIPFLLLHDSGSRSDYRRRPQAEVLLGRLLAEILGMREDQLYPSVLNRIMEISEQAYRNFQRHVDRLCFLIVATECPDRELDIERLHLRVQAMSLFPEKIAIYDIIYESRFRRLRDQFRCSNDRQPAVR